MVWSVCLLGEDQAGVPQRIDLLSLGALDAPVDIDAIGINQATGKQLLCKLQHAVVALQDTALRAVARQLSATSPDITLKDYRIRKVQTLFGTVGSVAKFAVGRRER